MKMEIVEHTKEDGTGLGVYEAVGFLFESKQEAEKAIVEKQKILSICEKLDFDNIKMITRIYERAIENGLFSTPVGYSFLEQLQQRILSDSLDSPQLHPIVVINNSLSKRDEQKNLDEEIEKEAFLDAKRQKRQVAASKNRMLEVKNKLFRSQIMNLFLILCIIVLFVITITGETPNIMNYRIALENKYAAWEMDLREKEQELVNREQELLKSSY